MTLPLGRLRSRLGLCDAAAGMSWRSVQTHASTHMIHARRSPPSSVAHTRTRATVHCGLFALYKGSRSPTTTPTLTSTRAALEVIRQKASLSRLESEIYAECPSDGRNSDQSHDETRRSGRDGCAGVRTQTLPYTDVDQTREMDPAPLKRVGGERFGEYTYCSHDSFTSCQACAASGSMAASVAESGIPLP